MESVSQQPSRGSTVPNSPTQLPVTSGRDDQNGDFARLVPANRLAHIAFNDVAEKMKANSSWRVHARKYIYIRDTKGNAFHDLSSSETDTDFSTKSSLWTGYYRFNLDILPLAYHIGWVAGIGRDDLDHGGVDFMLACSKGHHVAGRHARFSHTPDGVLLISSDLRRIVIDGKEEFRKEQRAFTSPTTGLTFGDLTYTLVFTNLPEYRAQLSKIRREHGVLYQPPGFLDPTPSTNDYVLQDYIVKGVFAQGSTCTVSAGVHRVTAKSVAIKKIKRTPKNSLLISREVKILRTLTSHPRICKLVGEIIVGSEAGLEPVDEAYLIYSPLAESRLHDLISSDMDDDNRVTVIWQCLEGINYVHEKGIIHRDIKPANIAIVSETPLNCQLIDFGSATQEAESMDHMAGTVRYLAPEVMALKNKQSQRPYNKAVDIWSFGVTSVELIRRRLMTWSFIDKASYVTVKTMLYSQTEENPPIIDLIDKMLTWSPSNRISAPDAIRDIAFARVRGVDVANEVPSAKRPRHN